MKFPICNLHLLDINGMDVILATATWEDPDIEEIESLAKELFLENADSGTEVEVMFRRAAHPKEVIGKGFDVFLCRDDILFGAIIKADEI